MLLLVGLLAGIILAAVIAYFAGASLRRQLSTWRDRATTAEAAVTAQAQANELALAQARSLFEEKIAEVTETATTTLEQRNKAFLDSAEKSAETTQKLREEKIDEKVRPVTDLLGKLLEQVQLTQLQNVGIATSIKALDEAEVRLRTQTSDLTAALKSTSARGRWGEIQLRRVIELAGMVENCDFTVQRAISADNRSRPDVIIRLPGGKTVPVDSKVPFDEFRAAFEAETDAEAKAHLQAHTAAVRKHIADLGSKEYWKDLDAEFVVVFFSPDALLATAYENDPDLIEYAASRKVLLTTPITLIGLLRAVAYGWSQHSVAQNANRIHAIGAELYERLSAVADKISRHTKNLDAAVRSNNEMIASFETRLLPSARKMHELGIASDDIALSEPIETVGRPITAGELTSGTIATPAEGE